MDPAQKPSHKEPLQQGMAPEKVHSFEESDLDAMWESLKPLLLEGTWVLVKGSRGMRLERIAQRIESYNPMQNTPRIPSHTDETE